MNQIGLVGHLTKDPNLRQLSNSKTQASFVVAINRNFRNSHGTVDADYLLCIAWGKLAQRIAKYCGKGSLIGINGRLQSRSYVNKDNNRIFTMEVVAEDVRFYALKSRDDGFIPPMESGEEVTHTEEHFMLPEEEEVPVST